ncbi:MAG: hypothetical protein ABL868_06960 [Sulfuriferula sp.]
MNKLKLSLLVTALIVSSGAFAHSDEYLDIQVAPHGGQLRMVGNYHYELVVAKNSNSVQQNAVIVYVTDHAGNKIATKGATGSVTILSGKLKSTALLQADGDNGLKGSAKYASTPDMKAVVMITFAGQKPEQARFTPLAVAKDGHGGHMH